MAHFRSAAGQGGASEGARVAAITAALAAVLDVPAAEVKIRSITPVPGPARADQSISSHMWSWAGRRDITAARSTFPMGRRN